MKELEICLEGIDGGAILNQANQALQDAVRDVCDLNKPAKEKRKIKIEITLMPSESREQIGIMGRISSTFPGMSSVVDVAYCDVGSERATVVDREQGDLFRNVDIGVEAPKG